MRVNVYVDGFNLYYGALLGTPYRWLDLASFAGRMLRKDDTIGRIRYCTARVDDRADPDAAVRQAVYLRALRTRPSVDLHFGSFLTTFPMMRPVGGGRSVRVRRTAEKGSDVNLAAYLMLDACRKEFEAALVISNDSDLATPIRLVSSDYGLPVGVAMPLLNRNAGGRPRVPSAELQSVSSFQRFVGDEPRWHRHLRNSQFPTSLRDANGSFSKPPSW